MSPREKAKQLLQTYQPRPSDVHGQRVLECVRQVAAGEGSILLSASVDTLHAALATGDAICRIQAEDSVLRWGNPCA